MATQNMPTVALIRTAETFHRVWLLVCEMLTPPAKQLLLHKSRKGRPLEHCVERSETDVLANSVRIPMAGTDWFDDCYIKLEWSIRLGSPWVLINIERVIEAGFVITPGMVSIIYDGSIESWRIGHDSVEMLFADMDHIDKRGIASRHLRRVLPAVENGLRGCIVNNLTYHQAIPYVKACIRAMNRLAAVREKETA